MADDKLSLVTIGFRPTVEQYKFLRRFRQSGERISDAMRRLLDVAVEAQKARETSLNPPLNREG